MTVVFDPEIGEIFLAYARRVVARGYIHNSLGNLAVRVPHPEFPDGVAYTKHAEVSQATNSLIMENHGVTTLGRSISEAYHRLNTLTSEVRRSILAERLAALHGTDVHYIDPASVGWMYSQAESVIYPSRVTGRETSDRLA